MAYQQGPPGQPPYGPPPGYGLAEGTPIVSLWVQNAADHGTVTCRIKVDGKTVRQAKSTGPYGVCRVQVNSLGE
ncbi:UNVERIFIED_ORG: hypothetical protein FHR35_003298 [Microbispora rosea subsp. rosea]